MRLAYFDCFSGISGDMILGALVDMGVPLKELAKRLSCLPITGYKLNAKIVKRAGFKATKVDVKLQGSEGRGRGSAKKWKDIKEIINASTLSSEIKQKGLNIFKRLFEAEANVHGERFDKVHLHELGAVDCIIDIFGVLISLDMLDIEKIYSSPLNLGSGAIKTGHGILSVPAPATIELLKNVPVYSSDVSSELTTPTGAVIISSIAEGFGLMPHMQVSKIGIGAGNKDFKNQPNVLRVFIGEDKGQVIRVKGQEISVIETNIDDMNPQIYEYVMERLFKTGALDVFLTQVIMKKGRPGIKLTVLCNNNRRDDLIKIIFSETTSIGLRFYEVQRETLNRTIELVDTKFGKMRRKISRLRGNIIKITPEYEDCKKIARKLKIPLIDVIKAVKGKALHKPKFLFGTPRSTPFHRP